MTPGPGPVQLEARCRKLLEQLRYDLRMERWLVTEDKKFESLVPPEVAAYHRGRLHATYMILLRLLCEHDECRDERPFERRCKVCQEATADIDGPGATGGAP